MPMNRALYPKDWETIALAIKKEKDWICEAEREGQLTLEGVLNG